VLDGPSDHSCWAVCGQRDRRLERGPAAERQDRWGKRKIPLTDAIASSWWIGPGLWALAYVSDYCLTVAAARLYRRGAHDHYVFDGSYELTPVFQKDIDEVRWFSPTFAAFLVGTGAMLVGLQWAASYVELPEAYLVALGALLLVEVPIHLRHARNLIMFHVMSKGQVTGRLAYPRWVVLRMSAMELGLFALLYALLFVGTQHWMLLGGALKTGRTALSHWKMATVAEIARTERVAAAEQVGAADKAAQ
jgi:hypothetical protein